MIDFYEMLDIIFDKLYEMHGLNDDIIDCKAEILRAYEKERRYRHEFIYRDVRDKQICVDENGYAYLK
jgi:hypothetical protein